MDVKSLIRWNVAPLLSESTDCRTLGRALRRAGPGGITKDGWTGSRQPQGCLGSNGQGKAAPPPLGTNQRQPQGGEKPQRQQCAPQPTPWGLSKMQASDFRGRQAELGHGSLQHTALSELGPPARKRGSVKAPSVRLPPTAVRNSSPVGRRFPRGPLSTPLPSGCPGRPPTMGAQVSWLQR